MKENVIHSLLQQPERLGSENTFYCITSPYTYNIQ